MKTRASIPRKAISLVTSPHYLVNCSAMSEARFPADLIFLVEQLIHLHRRRDFRRTVNGQARFFPTALRTFLFFFSRVLLYKRLSGAPERRQRFAVPATVFIKAPLESVHRLMEAFLPPGYLFSIINFPVASGAFPALEKPDVRRGS